MNNLIKGVVLRGTTATQGEKFYNIEQLLEV